MLECSYCGDLGHTKENCYKMKYGETTNVFRNLQVSNNNQSRTIEQEEPMLCITDKLLKCNNIDMMKNVWLADSGASHHVVNSKIGLVNIRKFEQREIVKVANGHQVEVEFEGDFKGTVYDVDGKCRDITIKDVSYVPSLEMNLLSLTKVIDNGYNLGNRNRLITIENDQMKLEFDEVLETRKGYLAGIKICPRIGDTEENDVIASSVGVKVIDINVLHEVLGHPHQDIVRKTGKEHNFKVIGKFVPCIACALGKVKQRNLNKFNKNKSKIPGERLYVDLSGIASKSIGGSKYWMLVIDDFTKFKWSYFLKRKNELSEILVNQIKSLRNQDYQIKYIRCDNAGENGVIEKALVDYKIKNIEVEFCAPYTPQQNGVVERSFAFLYDKVRSMLNRAGFTRQERINYWAECANMAVKLDNVLVRKEKSGYSLFYGKEPKWIKNMKSFGEVGVIKQGGNKMKHKLDNKGRTVMMIGYSDQHPSGTFRFMAYDTKRVILSRDVLWLDKYHGEYIGTSPEEMEFIEVNPSFYEKYFESDDKSNVEIIDDESVGNDENQEVDDEIQPCNDDEDVEENEEAEGVLLDHEEIVNEEELGDEEYYSGTENVIDVDNPKNDLNTRLMKEIALDDRELRSGKTRSQSNNIKMEIGAEIDMCYFMKSSNEVDPVTFADAWDHADVTEKEKWREAICKELNDMLKRNVWTEVDNDYKRTIGLKWVFKKKTDGRYRARLVALGYRQIAGIDYHYVHAPVLH